MTWEDVKFWILREKRIKVKIVANNGKIVKSFTARSVTIKSRYFVFVMENHLKIKVSNGLDCVIEEVCMYNGIIIKN